MVIVDVGVAIANVASVVDVVVAFVVCCCYCCL